MQAHHTSSLSRTLTVGLFFVGLAGGLGYEYKEITTLKSQVELLTTELSSTNADFAAKMAELNNQTIGISTTLSQNVDALKNQVGGVEQAVGSISGTVGNLQKLAQVEPELLKKYSKVFFLSENYIPAHLTAVSTDYVYSTTRGEQFVSEAAPFLNNLLINAKAQGVSLFVKSGFRSFAEQKSLKTAYSVTYGAGTANSFSAEQGYSEHQLGTTVDFITNGLGGKLDGFEKTQAHTWLLANAYRYGFIMSYPKGNKYYVYEPWHWRFVGIKLATYLHDNNLNFYDLDQRTIDSYLVNTFDN